MSLLSLVELRALVTTGLSDARLQVVIDAEDDEVVRRYGAHYTNATTTVTSTLAGNGWRSLFLPRPVTSISSVSEVQALGGSSASVAASSYQLWAEEGRLERINGTWGALVTVVYVPGNDNARRRQVLIELCRLALEQTALVSEDTADEYKYTAPDNWEQVRARLYRRLGYPEI